MTRYKVLSEKLISKLGSENVSQAILLLVTFHSTANINCEHVQLIICNNSTLCHWTVL